MMNNSSNIKLGTIENIVITPNKDKESFYRKTKKIKNLPDCYGILTERRNHKVETDENKLYGTNKTHKYY